MADGSSAITESTNANISATTRDMWIKTRRSAIYMKMPMLAKLLMRQRVTWSAGDKITRPIEFAEMDSLGQSYTVNEAMTSGTVTTMTKPWFSRKRFQLPLKYTVDEWEANVGSGGGEEQVINFARYLVEKGQRGARLYMYKKMFHVSTTDAGAYFQSIPQALDHSVTYGHTTRTATTVNAWWQGVSLADTFTDQDTAVAASINTVRNLASKCSIYGSDKRDMMLLVGPTVFLNLKSQVDASNITTNPGEMVKYGFESFTIDSIEVVRDDFLDAGVLSAETSPTTPTTWMFLLNVYDWELRLHPQRQITLTPFKYQGENEDATDSWLARIMASGNLVCWHPRGNGWLSNVSQ